MDDSGRGSLATDPKTLVQQQTQVITGELISIPEISNNNTPSSNMSETVQASGSPSSTQSSEYKIAILGEDNFTTWKWQMEFILNEKGLLEIVKTPTLAGYQPTKKDLQASSILASSLSQLNMQRVINCRTANEIWTALEASFENKSMTERTMLMDQFTSYKIKSIKDVSVEIGMIQSLANRLKTLGASIDDQMIISILLKALPESLKTWKATWKMVNAEKPNLNNLITGVMAEISEMKAPHDTAMLATNSKNSWRDNSKSYQRKTANLSKGMKSQQRDKGRCFYCDRPGHWISECRKKQSDERKSQGQGRNNIAMMAITTTGRKTKGLWIADSGCSTHMTPNKEWINNYEDFIESKPITLGNGTTIPAKGSGKIITCFGTMNHVHYVPDLSANLFSISAAAENGIVSKYYKDSIELSKGDTLIIKGLKLDGVYTLEFEISIESEKALTAVSLEEWHKRLAHTPEEVIVKMSKEKMVENLDISQSDNRIADCIDCVMGKCKHSMHQPRTTDKTQMPGVSLHFDTVGPFRQESLGGAKYFLLCKDEASSYKFGFSISTKSEIPTIVKRIISMAELQSKNRNLCINTDNGSEFINYELDSFLKEKGINHKTSIPYVPQQNGFIEREVRTVIETARTLLHESGLPHTLWAEATNTTIYVLNRTPNTETGNKTPYELWFGKKPSVKNLHVFGQKAIVMYRDYERSKWDQKGMIYHFVGYTDITNTFRFYDPEREQVYISCDAIFIDQERKSDNSMLKYNKENVISVPETIEEKEEDNTMIDNNDLSWSNEFEEQPQENIEEIASNQAAIQNVGIQETDITEDETEIAPVKVPRAPKARVTPYKLYKGHQRRLSISEQMALKDAEKKYTRRDHLKSAETIKKPSDIHPGHIVSSRLRSHQKGRLHAKLATLESEEDPKTFEEAMKRINKEKWIAAMKEEIQSFKKNSVYELVERPNTNIVTNKWVFKIRRDPQGKIERYKARLVARGFSQIHGVDYMETYAPVASMTSIRMLFAYAASEKLEIAQFDIKTAFLYGELNETVYMEQPEGFIEDENKVCLLKRSLYGLKQAPRQWNQKFTVFLKELNLNVSEHDGCVFHRMEPMLIIAIYVDDGIIFSKEKKYIDQTMEQLQNRFEVHSCDVSTFLGFQIHRGKNSEVALHQTSYINTILKRFNMENSKPTDSPISTSQSLMNNLDSKELLNSEVPYREAVGSLMYAAVITRLDIINAVTKVAQKVESPTMQDWVAVKRIFRYLKGKEDYSIKYKETDNKNFTVYCDADFAGDTSTSRSTTGSVFIYGGGPIHWKSQRQKLITLSSTEAEFVSLCSTTKEVIWLRKLARELNIIDSSPTVILCYNHSAIKIALNEKSVHRTRHMSVQANYPREQIEAGEINIEYVKSEKQLADMLTKPTTIKKFMENRNKLMCVILIILQLLSSFVRMSKCTNAYFFNKVSPLVFEPVRDKFVETGTTLYELEMTFSSPCDTIPVNNTHKYAQDTFTTDDYNMYKTIFLDCNLLFEQHWTTRVQELLQTKYELQEIQKPTNEVRVKRNPFLLLWIGVPIVVTIITNLITTLSSYYVPYGDSKRIDRVIGWVEDQQAIDKSRLERLAQRYNQSDEIQKGIIETLSSITKIVYHNRDRIEHLTDRMPHMIWEGAYLQNVIQDAGGKLQYVIDHYQRTGQAATKHMASLWNMTDLKIIDPEDTRIEEIIKLSNATIVIKMAVRNKSPDTRIFRIIPFTFWSNITGDPFLSKYVGSQYLIYNMTSNCMKAIEKPDNTRSVSEECKTKNWKDTKLTHFTRISKEEEELYNKPVSKRIGMDNYIYCYKYNITINEEAHECPTHVFKLPITTSFNTLGHSYTAKNMQTISSGPNWKIIDTSLPGALIPEQNTDELNLLKSLEELKKEQIINHNRAEEVIIITKYGNAWWAFNTMIFIVLSIIIIASLKWYRKKRQQMLRHVSFSENIDEISSIVQDESTINEPDK